MSYFAAWGIWGVFALFITIICTCSTLDATFEKRPVPVWPLVLFGVWVCPVALRALLMVLTV